MSGRALLAALMLACAGCAEPVTIDAATFGAQLFADPSLSASEFNTFSCATCHTTSSDPASAARLPAGHSLANAAFRASYWGGDETSLLAAVNACTTLFMRGVPFTADDPKGRALFEYLVQLSPKRDATALPLDVVENITDVARGDVARGAVVWAAACESCHGAPHTGEGRISKLASLVPESSIELASQLKAEPSLVVTEKIRHGPLFGVGGNMPFFSREALSDEDLGALMTFLGL